MPAQPTSPAREAIRGTVPKLAEISDTLIYGEVWERPGLSRRDRSLITVASLLALGREKQLEGHLARPRQRRDPRRDQRAHHAPRLLRRLARRDDRRAGGKGRVRDDTVGSCNKVVVRAKAVRKAEEAGVEPTEDACAPSNGFEARAPHRERYSSGAENAAVLSAMKGLKRP